MKEFYLDITNVSEEEFRQWYGDMSPARQEKCRRIVNEKGKKLCIAADRLAKTALSEVLRLPKSKITIKVSPSGKPYIEGNSVYFSISHSGNRAFCAVAAYPIGIDAEEIRTVSVKSAERLCTQQEKDYLDAAKDETEKNLRFLTIWTRKEAIFKVIGNLPRDDKNTEVLDPDTKWSITTRTEDNYIISVAKCNIMQKN